MFTLPQQNSDITPLPDDQQTFERLFADWYGNLYNYAFAILKDGTAAEEVVQSVFCKIWERRQQTKVKSSVKAYLFGAVYHESVDWIRQKRRTKDYTGEVALSVADAAASMEFGELEKRVQKALDELPDRCRAVFLLSRFSGLSYREIALQMNISVKTVEAQMSKALKHLRKRLSAFL